MAQITLTTYDNAKSFELNDNEIVYMNPYIIDDVVVGTELTVTDTAAVNNLPIYVSETVAEILALTNKVVTITLIAGQTTYISIERIVELITVNSLAVIVYNNNGNVYQRIKTDMTVAEILAAIQVQTASGNNLETVLTNGNETGNNDIRFTNGGANITSDASLSIAPDLNLTLFPTEDLTLQSGTEILTIYPVHTKFTGLVAYADNAAALTAGLVAGDTYILDATKALTVVV